MRNTFEFAGINSETYGIWLENSPPMMHGIERVETVTMPGSAKVLHVREGEGAMDPLNISLDCVISADGDLGGAVNWLRGTGTLILPNDEGHFYRNAWATAELSFEKVIRAQNVRRFTATFEVEAWRYVYPESSSVLISASGSRIENPYTGFSEPLIKVSGTGSGTLMIGDKTMLLDDIDEYTMLDCDARMAYKGETNLNATITRVGDDWPIIPAGGCRVSWSGGITGVEITPRYRDY